MKAESDSVKPGSSEGWNREVIFRLRGLLPVPAIFIMLTWSHPTSASFAYGGIALLIGESIRLWAAGYIKKYRVSEVQADALVTAGPYAHVRNPLYWGNFLIGLGFSVIAHWWPAYVLFVAVYAYVYSAVVPLEEAFLAKTFGSEYAQYRQAVPRFSPRFGRYDAATGDFSLREALVGELVTLGVLATVVALFAVKLFL